MKSNLVQIVEVGPRDGLQNEKRLWSVAERIELIRRLALCGLKEIEVGSFVSPKWVPQMAGTDQIYVHLKDVMQSAPSTRFSILVPNTKGMDLAVACGVKDISIFTAASESFAQKNINCTIEESFVRFEPLIVRAQENGMNVRGYVSCVIECPYEGAVDPLRVAQVAYRLHRLGCREISLGDTIGKGAPETIRDMIQAVKDLVPVENLAIHCHDTFGTALDNILVCLEAGVRIVDSSVKGLGGCPYGGAQAKGNVATESVVSQLTQYGYVTEVDSVALADAMDYVMSLREG